MAMTSARRPSRGRGGGSCSAAESLPPPSVTTESGWPSVRADDAVGEQRFVHRRNETTDVVDGRRTVEAHREDQPGLGEVDVNGAEAERLALVEPEPAELRVGHLGDSQP